MPFFLGGGGSGSLVTEIQREDKKKRNKDLWVGSILPTDVSRSSTRCTTLIKLLKKLTDFVPNCSFYDKGLFEDLLSDFRACQFLKED